MKVELEFDDTLWPRIEAVFAEEGREREMAKAVMMAVGQLELNQIRAIKEQQFQGDMESEAARINKELGLAQEE